MIAFTTYLPSSIVTVTWFTVQDWSCLLEEESVSSGFLFLSRQKPGFLGWGIVAVSLLNIRTTDDIVGLSSARSWTHKSPTCMHLNTSEGEYESPTEGSIISDPFPSVHSFQACKSSKSFFQLAVNLVMHRHEMKWNIKFFSRLCPFYLHVLGGLAHCLSNKIPCSFYH